MLLASIQAYGRGFLARKTAQLLRTIAAATKLQAIWRATRQQRRYFKQLRSIVVLQAAYRGKLLVYALRQYRLQRN